MEIQAAILLVIVFFLMLAFSVPVSYSIIVSALVTIVAFLTPGFGVFVSAQKMVSGIDSFSLIAVPFFILAGLLMNSGGIAKRLINLALLVLGKVPGSLALTNIAGNAMFGSISGSGIAAATAIGGVMLPLEKEQKYDEGFAAAVNSFTGQNFGAGWTADSSDNSVYRILGSRRWCFGSGAVYGWMDSGTSVGCMLHGSCILLCKKAGICN